MGSNIEPAGPPAPRCVEAEHEARLQARASHALERIAPAAPSGQVPGGQSTPRESRAHAFTEVNP